MSVLKKIEQLEKKFKTIDDKIKELIDNSKKANKLLTKIDFIDKIGITIDEYDLLQDYNDIYELSNIDIKRIIKLNDDLERKFKYIDLINEKIVLSCADYKVINKNTISYLLNKNKNQTSKSNVIINIYVDDNENKVDLETLKLKGKDEPRE